MAKRIVIKAAGDERSKPNFGGAEGDRTPDLVNAIHALYQLSYDPDPFRTRGSYGACGLRSKKFSIIMRGGQPPSALQRNLHSTLIKAPVRKPALTPDVYRRRRLTGPQ